MGDKKVLLVIMDGWGLGREDETNAIFQAATPFTDGLNDRYPHTTLVTHGESVGLPEGQMGNSEVGHLNIGAGRIVYQELMRINRAIDSGSFFEEPVLLEAFKYAINNDKPIHLFGLVSDGGVHSHIEHAKAICTLAHKLDFAKLYIHAFTDGRDTDPKSGIDFIADLEAHMAVTSGHIASMVGRYYAMDRDKRWERIKLAYDLLVRGEGNSVNSCSEALRNSYKDGITDEFLLPHVVTKNGEPLAVIKDGDVIFCFNFRTDRPRQLLSALTVEAYPDFDMKPLEVRSYSMTRYSDELPDTRVIYSHQPIVNTLGAYLSAKDKSQLRIAETEKYPHVTFFFNGGREKVFPGEERILVPSPKVATYDLQPSMSALAVKDKVINAIKTEAPDFICLNFANADMVGHTGDFSAAVKACETVDMCVQEVVYAAIMADYAILITADHGNADFMINPDGSPNTAHTKNPVPLWLLDKNISSGLKSGILGALAPTILELMGLPQPPEMECESLLQ